MRFHTSFTASDSRTATGKFSEDAVAVRVSEGGVAHEPQALTFYSRRRAMLASTNNAGTFRADVLPRVMPPEYFNVQGSSIVPSTSQAMRSPSKLQSYLLPPFKPLKRPVPP